MNLDENENFHLKFFYFHPVLFSDWMGKIEEKQK